MIIPPTHISDPPQKSGPSAASSQPSLDDPDDFFSTYFTQKLDQDDAMESNELDDYLNDHREKFLDDFFDILVWWRINGNRYKIVSQMAKDVLAIQVSTVASESAFSTGGRILDPFRSSLSPKMVQALICAKNWLSSKKEPLALRQYMDDVEAFKDSKNATKGNIQYIIHVLKFVLLSFLLVIVFLSFYVDDESCLTIDS